MENTMTQIEFSELVQKYTLPKYTLRRDGNERIIESVRLVKIMFQASSFMEIRFEYVTFEECDISSSVLKGSSFSNCRFVRCDMNSVIMSGAKFTNCTFENCSLVYGNFPFASIIKTEFIGCDLRYVTFDSAVIQQSTFDKNCDLSFASFVATNLSSCTLPYPIYIFGPVGSESGYLIYKVGIDQVTRGCFTGTLEQFTRKVKKRHQHSYHGKLYLELLRVLRVARKQYLHNNNILDDPYNMVR